MLAPRENKQEKMPLKGASLHHKIATVFVCVIDVNARAELLP